MKRLPSILNKVVWRCSQPIQLLFIPMLILGLLALPHAGRAQGKDIVVNLAPIDGLQLTPDNLFAFGIQSGMPGPVTAAVKGTLRYRQSGLSFSYTFNTVLRPGMNMMDGSAIHPAWTFSSGAFRELFLDYKKLPEGTYEYCVSVSPINQQGEHEAGGESNECLYGKSDDVFLINLVSPENGAKIYEHYPVFSWVVNYPFASQLTYRIRVAEIKQGQNTVGAVTRNNPVYQESNLPQTTTTYPVYGAELKTFQPYGWTVDAYYKGILLGGAEPWKFTIVEDSELVNSIPKNISYYDFKKHYGESYIFGVGVLKLEYMSDLNNDVLQLSISGQGINKSLDSARLHVGNNQLDINLNNKGLAHLKRYDMIVTDLSGRSYRVPFIYVNPELL